jgi:hypothetical protein
VAAAGVTVEAAAGTTVRVAVARAGAAPEDPAPAEVAPEVVDRVARVARGDPAATATAVGGRCSAVSARAASAAA